VGSVSEPDCLFCRIVRGDAPATRVYEDDDVVAFLDIRPFAAGHTLIVPRRHAAGLADLDPDDGAKVFRVAQRIARALRASSLPVDGINLVLNDGAAAAQTVFHVHVHAIPRQTGDKLKMARRLLVRRSGDLEDAAARVRAGLARLAAEGR
jgi:histidine triad (HIT) family protein